MKKRSLFIIIVLVQLSYGIYSQNTHSIPEIMSNSHINTINRAQGTFHNRFSNYEDHTRISIKGNAEFATKATTENWPGDGTSNNPYIIEGYKINQTGSTFFSAIEIRETDVYFQIRNCHLIGGYSGIDLQQVQNGHIFNNTIYMSDLGIYLAKSWANRIDNNTISNSTYDGIHLFSSGSCLITNNTVFNNGQDGIALDYGPESTITSNFVFSNERDGIVLASSQTSTVSQNTIFTNKNYGILLVSSGNSTISSNYVYDNINRGILASFSGSNWILNNNLENNGLYIIGNGMGHYSQKEVTNNRINGKALIYWQNVIGETVPPAAGQVILVNCTSVDVSDQKLSNTTTGVLAAFSAHLTIHNNIISHNSYMGISLHFSTNNTISHNDISRNIDCGIQLYYSENNRIHCNNFVGNSPNTSQACDAGSNNTFLYNYWGDWTSPDVDGDGIVDQPYSIQGTANNHDQAPMIVPITTCPISIPAVSPSRTSTVTVQVPEFSIELVEMVLATLAVFHFAKNKWKKAEWAFQGFKRHLIVMRA